MSRHSYLNKFCKHNSGSQLTGIVGVGGHPERDLTEAPQSHHCVSAQKCRVEESAPSCFQCWLHHLGAVSSPKTATVVPSLSVQHVVLSGKPLSSPGLALELGWNRPCKVPLLSCDRLAASVSIRMPAEVWLTSGHHIANGTRRNTKV